MKKIFIISQILYYSLFAQGNIYPTETSYGGGIGFGNMYMILNQVPGSSVLDSIGFDVDELQTRPLVFYGGEGFAQMIGPWRLGGYAGIGSAQISNVYDIQLYKNEVGGLSGKPLFIDSTIILKKMYSLTNGQIPLIGVGGITNGNECYEKIKKHLLR